MKIIRVISHIPIQSTLQPFMERAEVQSLPYEGVLEKLRQEALLYPVGFKKNMGRLGWEVLEVLPGWLWLQQKWVQENSAPPFDDKSSAWQERVFIQQLQHFKPQIVYFDRGAGFLLFSHAFRRKLKRQFPFLKLIVGSWGTAGVDGQQYADVDMMFSMDAAFDRHFKTHRVPSQICYHCFDEELLGYSSATKGEDFVFVGVSGHGFSDHRERYGDLLWLLEKSPLKAWIFEARLSRKAALRHQLIRSLSRFPLPFIKALSFLFPSESLFSRLIQPAIHVRSGHPDYWSFNRRPLRALFPRQTSDSVFGAAYFQLLGRSKIILNRHTDAKGNYGNMRTFEVCGMGGCLLTDRGQEMRELFEPDREIVTYESREECLEKMRYLLQNEAARSQIAAQGQKRVLKEHLFSQRALQIDETLRGLLKS